MLLVAVYVPLAGGGPSIQRAGVMGVAGPRRRARRPSGVALVRAGAGGRGDARREPARRPEEPGWQLSFAAVVGLLALAPGLRDAGVRRGLPRPLAEALAMTAAATVATGPLLAFHFEEVSIVSLAANLVVAPAVAPVMWLGMLGMAAGQLAPRLPRR